MIRIPLSNLSNQRFNVVLDGQNCTVTLKQNGAALYLSLAVDQVDVVTNHICNNDSPIPIFKTTAFSGCLVFHDVLGDSHPDYSGLSDRYYLVYLAEGEKWQA